MAGKTKSADATAMGRKSAAARGGSESKNRNPKSGIDGAPGNGKPDTDWLVVRGAAQNNLKELDVAFPLGRFVCVTGVSGSGKSSLVNDILHEALALKLNKATTAVPGKHAGIDGLQHLDKVIAIDQSPIGRTPRSNPATYIKVFDEIRNLFTKLPDAKLRGYKPGRFSFNVEFGRKGGGRCEACQGNGANCIEMDFLADVWVTCPVCGGRRFNRETLQIHFKEKSIADVLDMDVQDALNLFDNQTRIRAMLQTLHDVGLDYIKLGQSSTTLSGGEAQRIKLARELVKKPTGRTMYILDEPTTGLHFEDIRRLLLVLHGFVDAGNTVVVIEHNLDVLKTADWIIDLGPEGGEAGGRIVVEGTPEEVAACAGSYTGAALREVLRSKSEVRSQKSEVVTRQTLVGGEGRGRTSDSLPLTSDLITVRGARQHNLKDITVSFPREKTTVCTGLSGSGKTSFAIDTVFVEGHRRYVESLSAYARQFLGQMAKPRVEHVEGLSPAICIEQKAASKSPRSTVGTVTEIYDYMRVLWARVGTPHCPKCDVPIGSQTSDEIIDRVMALGAGTPIIVLAPVALGDGESWASMFNRLKASGYLRVRIDGVIQETAHAATIDARRRHRVEVVVDRAVIQPRSRGRVAESLEHGLSLGNGVVTVLQEEVETVETDEHGAAVSTQRRPAREQSFSQRYACSQCGTSYSELSPHHLSFNSPLGWCETCEGLGVQRGAPASEIVKQPGKTLLSGAIAGWDSIARGSPMGQMLGALCRHLDVDLDAPLRDWSEAQTRVLMFGSPDWIAASENDGDPASARPSSRTATVRERAIAPDAAPSANPKPKIQNPKSAGGPACLRSVRFRWKGFFPAIDDATRNSWMLRYKLQNVISEIPCITCRGGRLRPDAAAVRLGGRTIVDVCQLPLAQSAAFFDELELDATQRRVAGELLKEIKDRLAFLINVGLDYVSLHRSAPTLSGGESQRIRLASQIGTGLSGVLYVLDEPTIGLHPRDTGRLIKALAKLRDLGNTLLLVEHDRDVIRSADRILDFGPGAGRHGGHIVAQGPPGEMMNAEFRMKNAEMGATAAPAAGARIPEAGATAADAGIPAAAATAAGARILSRTRPAGIPSRAPGDAADSEATVSGAGQPASAPDISPEFRSLTRAYLSGAAAIPIPTNRRPVQLGVLAGGAADDIAGGAARPAARGRVTIEEDLSQLDGAADESQSKIQNPKSKIRHQPAIRNPQSELKWLVVRGARHNNLKNLDVPIPLGRFVCVTGVSGSGKSSLVNDILWPALAGPLNRANLVPGQHEGLEILDFGFWILDSDAGASSPVAAGGLAGRGWQDGPPFANARAPAAPRQSRIQNPKSKIGREADTRSGSDAKAKSARDAKRALERAIDRVINVDQSPIGSTPTSNPATYCGAFDWIRELFTRLPDAKVRGYTNQRFSFNRPGGRCEPCEGNGQKKIEMHFLPDVWVECETCRGRRYNPETLEIRYKGRSIADVLEMSVAEALDLFTNVPKIRRMLQTLADVGLEYLQLGQPAPTLSGGEAQRVKLAAELGKPNTGKTFYILDEPTTGLHFDDVRKLLDVLQRLVDLGNTVVVVEHNLDVLKSADWIIDLGPEAGAAGGYIVAAGTPEEISDARSQKSEIRSQKSGLVPRGFTSDFVLLTSDFVSHTASALAPILAAGPHAPRTVYDAAAHAAMELEIERSRLRPDVEKAEEAKMPWQLDGRKWHLEQRDSRNAKERHWEPAALEFVEKLIHEAGDFAPTDWNDRARVEIAARNDERWFFHALTGGEWLIEMYFRVPPGTFDQSRLGRQLDLKTLNERDDIPAYSDRPRVEVRPRLDGVDAIAVYVHDRAEIDTAGFRKFIKDAAKAYVRGMRNDE